MCISPTHTRARATFHIILPHILHKPSPPHPHHSPPTRLHRVLKSSRLDEGHDVRNETSCDEGHNGLAHIFHAVEGVLLHKVKHLTHGLRGNLYAGVVHLEHGERHHVEHVGVVVHPVEQHDTHHKLHVFVVEHHKDEGEEVHVESKVRVECTERKMVIIRGVRAGPFLGEVVLTKPSVPDNDYKI